MQSGYPETPGLKDAVKRVNAGHDKAEEVQRAQAGRARLNAAAPDILAALKDALWAIDNMSAILTHHGISSTLDDPRPQMRAAIAKAEGREG